MTVTRQLVIRSWNFSSRLACFLISDRIASEGSEFWKVISSGTCILCPFTTRCVTHAGQRRLNLYGWHSSTGELSPTGSSKESLKSGGSEPQPVAPQSPIDSNAERTLLIAG